jgi:hypothetical protein
MAARMYSGKVLAAAIHISFEPQLPSSVDFRSL